MLDIASRSIYQVALTELRSYARSIGDYRGRFVQIFLALKFYRDVIPSINSGNWIRTKALEILLDELYAKLSMPPQNCVLILFENAYRAKSYTQVRGHRSPQNTWRNNFHLQKGIGCYASATDLSNPGFLSSLRVDCPYLKPATPGRLEGATCRLAPITSRTGGSATYRGEEHRKWLRIDSQGRGFAVVDLNNIDNFVGYVAPNGRKVPIAPLIVALYYDSILSRGRTHVDVADFAEDFGFSSAELAAYFDDDVHNVHNSRLLSTAPGLSYTPISSVTWSAPSPTPTAVPAPPTRRRRRHRAIPAPSLTGTPVPPPTANTGWHAEQFVLEALQRNGWTVHNVRTQQLGYDLLAMKGNRTLYIDVKSSVGRCHPTLTEREWQQAKNLGSNYVLAIIENFNPSGSNVIEWVPDPANRCSATQRQITEYSLPRSQWSTATVPLSRL